LGEAVKREPPRLVRREESPVFTPERRSIVYERLGVAVLRKAWFNLDFAWAVALIGAGAFAAFT
jgi:hypothetical protein